MELTRNEKIMKLIALLYAIMFIITVIIFVFFSKQLLDFINAISGALFHALPLANDSGKFWLSMTVSMMAAITALSLMIYSDVRKNYRLAVPLVIAKFTSSLAGAGFFLAGFLATTGWNTLANLVIFFSDFPLGLLMLILYVRVARDQ